MTDPTDPAVPEGDDEARFSKALTELLSQRPQQARRAAFEDALQAVTRRTP